MIRFYLFLSLLCFTACQKSLAPPQQVVHLNLIKDPISLDPRKAGDLDSVTLVRMLFEGLTRSSKTGAIELALASKVEILEGGLCYIFHLRESQWSNGDLVTADDFVQSWKTILHPQFATAIAYQLYPIKNGKEAKLGIKKQDEIGVYAIDSKTLRVELEQPLPYFLELVSMTPFFPVHQKAVQDPHWTREGSHLICNGPFQLSIWKHSDQLVFSQNPKYWESAAVKLKGIEFMIASADTGLRLFEEKKLDWAGSPLSIIPSDAMETLKNRGQLQSAPFLATYFFRINTSEMIGGRKNPLKDPKLRRALSSAVDRSSIVENILQGGQTIANSLVPPEMGLLFDLPTKGPQLERAARRNPGPLGPGQASYLFSCGKELAALYRSGESPPVEGGVLQKALSSSLVISYMNNERNASVVQAIQKQWEQSLGITVELEAIEPKVFFQRVSQRDFQIALGNWTADFNDAINFLEVFKFGAGGINNTGWENEEYIDLLNRSALCKSAEERRDLLSQAQKILMEQMPIIPIFHTALNYLKQDELKEVVLSPIGQLDLRWAYLE